MVGFQRASQRFGLRLDTRGVALALVVLTVAATTAALTLDTGAASAAGSDGSGIVERQVEAGPPAGFSSDPGGEAAAGATFAVVVVAIAASLLAGLALYRRSPDWLRTTARRAALAGLLMYLGAAAAASGAFWIGVGAAAGGYALYRVADRVGLWWLANDVLVVGLAVGGGIVLGGTFGVAGMVALLLGLAVYDHVAANRTTAMFSLARPMIAARLPLLFYVPDRLRVDWDAVVGMAADVDEEAGEPGWAIGVADLLLVSGFVAAVASSSVVVPAAGRPVAVAAVLAGLAVAAFRLSWEMETRGSGAGLPALSAGVLVPYAVVAGLWILAA